MSQPIRGCGGHVYILSVQQVKTLDQHLNNNISTMFHLNVITELERDRGGRDRMVV